MWDILLTVFKFLGLIVSGVAGYIAAAPEQTKKRTEKPIPRSRLGYAIYRVFSKEWALRWAVIGLVVSLLSQFVETIKSNHDNQQAREKDRQQIARAEEQIRIAQDSLRKIDMQSIYAQATLDKVERVVTRFEDLEVHATFEFPAEGFNLKGTLNAFDEGFLAKRPPTSHVMAHPSRDSTVVFSKILAIHGTNSGYLSGDLLPTPDGGELDIPITLGELEQQNATNSIFQKSGLLPFLRSPKTTVSFSKNEFQNSGPDFVASSVPAQNVTIDCLLPSNRLRVSWVSYYPKTNWISNATMQSLPDLSQNKIIMSIDNYYPKGSMEADEVRALSVDIVFNAVPLNVKPLDLRFNGEVVSVIGYLPDEKEYLNLSKYIKPPSAGGDETTEAVRSSPKSSSSK
jgi:hypothetical protein